MTNMCQCLQCKALNRAIQSCKDEMKKIVNGGIENKWGKPDSFKGNDEQWHDIQEERYEYLENFMMKLKFIIEYPERKMQV